MPKSTSKRRTLITSPLTWEMTADAVKAEEMLADLQSSTELTGSLSTPATAGMSDEEKELYEELERETSHGSGRRLRGWKLEGVDGKEPDVPPVPTQIEDPLRSLDECRRVRGRA